MRRAFTYLRFWRSDLMAPVWILSPFLILTGCAGPLEGTATEPSYALEDTDDTRMGALARRRLAGKPEPSGFRFLANGLDAFVARAIGAQVAERSIDLQYYLYHDDLTGRLLTEQLIRAADGGVRLDPLMACKVNPAKNKSEYVCHA